MEGQKETKGCILEYPEDQLTPKDFLHFVELDEFRDDWQRLGLDVENDLWALQILIMCNPKGPPVIPGTGGLRKVRFAPDRWKVDKRGAARVCYAYFPAHWTVLLVAAYGKNEKDDLTHDERQGIRMYLRQVESWLEKRNY
jgi:hypothetical protein